jgi:hypothetical protein
MENAFHFTVVILNISRAQISAGHALKKFGHFELVEGSAPVDFRNREGGPSTGIWKSSGG